MRHTWTAVYGDSYLWILLSVSVWPLWQLQVLWWSILMSHTRWQLLQFAEAQAGTGVRKEGTPVLALPGWPWMLGSHQAGVRDRARGCSLPMQDRVEDNLKAPKWSSESRSWSPSLLLRDAGRECVRCLLPVPGNEVLASIRSDNANTNPMLPQFHISIVLHSTTISTTALGVDE